MAAAPSGAAAARVRGSPDVAAAPVVDAAAEMLRVLGDPTRLRIAHVLAHDELCVQDLAAVLDLEPSRVSHSLRALRQMRLVRHRRAGKAMYYALEDAHVRRLIEGVLRHAAETVASAESDARAAPERRSPKADAGKRATAGQSRAG